MDIYIPVSLSYRDISKVKAIISCCWVNLYSLILRKPPTMKMGERLIQPGEIMMILMNISGNIFCWDLFLLFSLNAWCRIHLLVTFYMFTRSQSCFELRWPMNKMSKFFLKPTPRSKVQLVLQIFTGIDLWHWIYFKHIAVNGYMLLLWTLLL